jgi:hypothetical protein
MKNSILIFLFVVLVACDNSGTKATNERSAQSTLADEKDDTTPPANNATVTVISGCYLQILKRDTIVLKLEQAGDEITGKLTIDNYEKDGSSGTVWGREEDGLIKLVYSFTSEGMKSVMDVYFKMESNGLIRGIGEVQTKGEKAWFANPEEVQYPVSGRFEKIACDQVPAKYR